MITDLGDATLEMSAAVEPGQGLHTGTVPGGAPGDLHLDPGHAAQLWAGWHLFVAAEMVGAADATLALSIGACHGPGSSSAGRSSASRRSATCWPT